ncbi:hypothetical protein [Halocella sp. SP3-1]|uniref:hypothetical protein n=1 Tax=Halocella sp. SP3-1 TaxID=2382161 RepID=UPI000F762245|nr:hypothetical protein [Halocella sp. SP3-1]AZO95682.1 hypothetical protein D7D81_14405 [Halocella sp. SP3-1]
MKKPYLIVIIVVTVFLLSVGVYYFAFYRYKEPAVVEHKAVGQPVEGFVTEGSALKKNSAAQGNMAAKPLIEDKELSNDEKPVIRYLYRSNFRDPFQNYGIDSEKSSPQLSLKDIREMISFELKGIITGRDKKIAIIDTGDRTRLITVNDTVDEFRVLKIRERDLLMSYQCWQFTIEMGSETDGYI